MAPYQGLSPVIGIIRDAVKRALNLNPKPNLEILFLDVWRFASKNLEIAQHLPVGKLFCDTQLTKNELLLLLIVQIIRQYGLDLCPTIQLSNKETFEELGKLAGPATVCGVHTGFAFLPTIMAPFGRKVSIISSDNDIRDTLTRSGREGYIEVIPRDLFSFIRLRNSMHKANLCVCSVDYSDGKLFQFISPSLFEFSSLNKFPVYFFKSEVNDEGKVQVGLKKSEFLQDPSKSAEEFILYITANQNPARELSIKKI